MMNMMNSREIHCKEENEMKKNTVKDGVAVRACVHATTVIVK